MVERSQSSSLAVAWAAVGLSALVTLGSVAKDYFKDNAAVTVTGVVTTEQVSKLTKQGEDLTRSINDQTKSINDLNRQIAAMPTTHSIEVMAARMDGEDGKINDLYNLTTGLRHDVDNRLPPMTYRNPTGGH